MVLQLHVWGPAFGLPSIDAECLAAIAYLHESTSPTEYQLIQTSPSAVPTQHLPALHDPSTSTWTSGFSRIATHLQTHPPPSFSDPSRPSPLEQADSTAYTAFLTQHAAPLLSLSLYVSSANYAAATRPAYSAILPFPLPWTEPPAVRAVMVRRAEHLGMSSLDTDARAEKEREAEERAAAEGWVTVPSALKLGRQKEKGVGGMLSPEQKARIRLEGLAADVLDVLGEVEDWSTLSLAARCLAFGYLALMMLPDVPRPWLREVMRRRYPELCDFVNGFRREVFPKGRTLPWAEDKAGMAAAVVVTRFARGALCEVPWIGEYWSQWWTAKKRRQVLAARGMKNGSSSGMLLLLEAGLGMALVGAGAFFYRGLPPFGEAVQVWRRPLGTLSGLGAAGAIFSGALYGLD
ncbi:Tom37 C-terminal domain-containing protein [Chaetomium strumarium]|uniref:Tom37 C-terminal domain-containing protein n=1 Tax=Chaetomium strumarium TaxID=1170767 RepID=A0AAJ0H0C8_9PEZI|nr:Tom37 C-terminal domain-containing protein [Chaetomium strumarium]